MAKASKAAHLPAIAIIEEQPAPVLIAADFEFEGMPVVRMRGDSMGDTLRDGDYVVIDQTDTHIGPPGIFAAWDLESGGRLLIRQVQRVFQDGHITGRIKCTPRNPRYMSFELTLGTEAIIIERVVQRITRRL